MEKYFVPGHIAYVFVYQFLFNAIVFVLHPQKICKVHFNHFLTHIKGKYGSDAFDQVCNNLQSWVQSSIRDDGV